MTTSMPISILENILEEVNKDSNLAKEEENQAKKNKEKVEKLKEILDIERSTEEEKSIPPEQKMERLEAQDSCKTTRSRPNNKQKAAKRSKSSS